MHDGHGMIEVNGTRLHCAVDGGGEAVVLVHGFGLDHRMWEPQLGPLAGRCRVVRYDVRGFGRSADPPAPDYSNVEDLTALLDHLQIEQAHLVGLSMGGGIAVETAIARPERVRSLVCVDAAIGGFGWSAGFLDDARSAVRLAVDGDLDAARARWLDAELFHRARANPRVEPLVRAMIEDYGGWHWRMRRDALDRGCIDALGEIGTRTLIVAGENDSEDFIAIATRLAEEVPDSSTVLIEDAGHLSNLENPAAFNRVLIDFLSP